jgi:Secretion system C-terminal sorting domain
LEINPNPSTGKFVIHFPEPLEEAATLRVLDLQGKLIKTEELPAGLTHQNVSLDGVVLGLYFVEIQTISGRKFEGKLMKI